MGRLVLLLISCLAASAIASDYYYDYYNYRPGYYYDGSGYDYYGPGYPDYSDYPGEQDQVELYDFVAQCPGPGAVDMCTNWFYGDGEQGIINKITNAPKIMLHQ